MLSPRRTWLLVTALAALGIAFAVGVTAAVERARPGALRLAAAPFAPAPIPRADLHQHVAPGTAADAVRLARAFGVELIVNLSGGTAGAGLEAALDDARRQAGRVVVFATLDLAGCCSAEWAARETDRLARGVQLGARGLAVPVALGPEARGADGTPLAASSKPLDPIWQACARLHVPVVLHARDHGGELAPRAADAIASVAARHPRIDVVGAHLGGAAGPAEVARLLARAPNLYLDTAAALGALGSDGDATRELLLAHARRFLFGSDLRYSGEGDATRVAFGSGPPGERSPREELLRFFDGTWRFYESRDPRVPAPGGEPDAAPLRGIGLPRVVLEQLYRRNAEILLGVKVPEAG